MGSGVNLVPVRMPGGADVYNSSAAAPNLVHVRMPGGADVYNSSAAAPNTCGAPSSGASMSQYPMSQASMSQVPMNQAPMNVPTYPGGIQFFVPVQVPYYGAAPQGAAASAPQVAAASVPQSGAQRQISPAAPRKDPALPKTEPLKRMRSVASGLYRFTYYVPRKSLNERRQSLLSSPFELSVAGVSLQFKIIITPGRAHDNFKAAHG